MMKMRYPCVLCGGASTGVGIFLPHDPKQYLAPMGKNRRILYSVCLNCIGRTEEIEGAIQTKLLAQVECLANA
jgi:hypothetical protein